MSDRRDPLPLSQVLSELIALRGYARRDANRELQNAWAAAAGEAVAKQTRAMEIKRGVLQVAVATSPLLSELVGFYRVQLVARLKALSPELRIKDVKFRLDGAAGRQGNSES
ncbi:MAG: DciA family protein [Planctomycetota bacterium]|nr:DciA family protein [Planctomycetota bacterium]